METTQNVHREGEGERIKNKNKKVQTSNEQKKFKLKSHSGMASVCPVHVQGEGGESVCRRGGGLSSYSEIQCTLLAVFVVHLAAVLPEVLVALHVELDQGADLHRVDLPRPAVADLVHGFPQDVLVLVLVNVFALVVWLDGQLHLLHCTLLRVELLKVLVRVFALTIPSHIA